MLRRLAPVRVTLSAPCRRLECQSSTDPRRGTKTCVSGGRVAISRAIKDGVAVVNSGSKPRRLRGRQLTTGFAFRNVRKRVGTIEPGTWSRRREVFAMDGQGNGSPLARSATVES